MNILVTGCAGFIGFSFALKILNSNKKMNILTTEIEKVQEIK